MSLSAVDQLKTTEDHLAQLQSRQENYLKEVESLRGKLRIESKTPAEQAKKERQGCRLNELLNKLLPSLNKEIQGIQIIVR